MGWDGGGQDISDKDNAPHPALSRQGRGIYRRGEKLFLHDDVCVGFFDTGDGVDFGHDDIG